MRFCDVVGQKELKEHLVRAADEGRVSHAQLFSGRSGYGTLPLALAYAQYVNCTDRHDGDSCGQCASCRKMAALEHADLHFVMPVNKSSKKSGEAVLSSAFLPQWRRMVLDSGGYFSEQEWYERIELNNQQGLISKADADEIIRTLSFKSFEAEYKVVVVWLPERMRTEAANTILKILEEPWEKTLFLLVSVSAQQLLPTILSRTQQVTVGGIEPEELERYVRSAYGADDIKAHSVARLACGDLLEVRRIMSEGEKAAEDEDFGLFVQLMRLSYNDKHLELIQWADTVAGLGRERQKQFLVSALRLLRESYMLNAGMDDISYLWGAERDFCIKFSPFIGNHNIENIVREIEDAIAQISQNGNAAIVFTHFALSVSKQIVRL